MTKQAALPFQHRPRPLSSFVVALRSNPSFSNLFFVSCRIRFRSLDRPTTAVLDSCGSKKKSEKKTTKIANRTIGPVRIHPREMKIPRGSRGASSSVSYAGSDDGTASVLSRRGSESGTSSSYGESSDARSLEWLVRGGSGGAVLGGNDSRVEKVTGVGGYRRGVFAFFAKGVRLLFLWMGIFGFGSTGCSLWRG